ncbi:uncharacterized protein LOC135822238 [Sycon ciliatum]|uniref:uncharacterized protein LOC135822238 n=1 Tax=Sycon ciliatum TaxID=27933 RepID=UPI0020AA42AD|eukprot:scpid15231/ scgid31243/ RNA exonuclease 4
MPKAPNPKPSEKAKEATSGKKKNIRFKKSIKKLPNPKPKERLHIPVAPKTPEEFSPNWKALQKILAMDKKPSAVSSGSAKKRTFKPRKKDSPTKGTGSSAKWKKTTPPAPAPPPPPEVWFDDVDPELIARSQNKTPSCSSKSAGATAGGNERDSSDLSSSLITGPDKEARKYIAIDCEFVGVGPNGSKNALARCSIVNHHGHVLYDTFVQPLEDVTDFRTRVSGVRPRDLKDAPSQSTVLSEVDKLMKGRVLVGHAIKNDLKALYLSHPQRMIRDTQCFDRYKKLVKGGKPGLKRLCRLVLNIDIQSGEHSSVEDAQATMKLYRLHRQEFEKDLKTSGRCRGPVKQRKNAKGPRREKRGEAAEPMSCDGSGNSGGESDGGDSGSWLR